MEDSVGSQVQLDSAVYNLDSLQVYVSLLEFHMFFILRTKIVFTLTC